MSLVLIDRSSLINFSENYHFIQGDLSDPTSIERAVMVQPTHVIHLGAFYKLQIAEIFQ